MPSKREKQRAKGEGRSAKGDEETEIIVRYIGTLEERIERLERLVRQHCERRCVDDEVRRAVEVVSSITQVPEAAIMGHSRHSEVVVARNLTWYLLNEHGVWSGRALDRVWDLARGSVRNGLQTVKNRMTNERAYGELVLRVVDDFTRKPAKQNNQEAA